MVNLLKKYLHKNGYYNQKDQFDDLFLSHPNYPSIFAITDTLDVLSIENIALKVPKEQFIDLPENFLAIYNGHIVLATKTSQSVTIETAEAKKQKLTFNEFLTGWNEVVIAIEPNANPVLKKERKNKSGLLYALPFLALIASSAAFQNYNINSIALLVTSIIGLVLSVFIVQEKLGVKNELASKFCNINPNASCDSVINSKKSEINKWIGFSDLTLLFFSISVVSILIQPEFSNRIIGFISLLAIPAIVYSIWLQTFELKKWCVLCLAVSFVIIAQSLVFSFGNVTWFDYSISHYYTFIVSTILLSSLWFSIKPIIENKVKFEKETNRLMRFKRNFNLFQFLSNEIEEYDDFEKLKGITFGNENAATQITLILSPSCGHCHTAFEDAYKLFQNYSEKIYLNILFNINPENQDNPYKTVLENLLAINEQDPKKAQYAIIDWHINQLKLEDWKQKWTVESPHLIVNKELQNQYYWCLKNDFNYTPVKIINGNLFPDEYEIKELKYFINDFNEEMEDEKSLQAV
ncbi:vitamin K epoxide reductase family protein [Flavobacterium terrigena]|uniref:Thioredoxin n=1 Tax=Flavobacterium terrigena TaxID=402734 RepID=A0A1H6VK89_9FLAO|nr:vitamin K epoxide reductase family protein [Flavobacterium terrigena]SEJ03394.1 Thioredoxin [Flavobacterium terrigena]